MQFSTLRKRKQLKRVLKTATGLFINKLLSGLWPESRDKIRPEGLISGTPELCQIATDSSTGAEHQRLHQKLIMSQRSKPHLHVLATANNICPQGTLNITVTKSQLVIFWLLFPRIENRKNCKSDLGKGLSFTKAGVSVLGILLYWVSINQ